MTKTMLPHDIITTCCWQPKREIKTDMEMESGKESFRQDQLVIPSNESTKEKKD